MLKLFKVDNGDVDKEGDEFDNDDKVVVDLPDTSKSDGRMLSDSDVLMITVELQIELERPVDGLENELVKNELGRDLLQETNSPRRSINESLQMLKRSFDENFECFGDESSSLLGEIFEIIDIAEATQELHQNDIIIKSK